jgi:hypothetical protein
VLISTFTRAFFYFLNHYLFLSLTGALSPLCVAPLTAAGTRTWEKYNTGALVLLSGVGLCFHSVGAVGHDLSQKTKPDLTVVAVLKLWFAAQAQIYFGLFDNPVFSDAHVLDYHLSLLYSLCDLGTVDVQAI